jgi:hypothetical protein
MNTGNARSNQELCETFFARRSAQRHAVQQNLIPRSAQQQSASAALIERAAQLLPRSFKLRRSPHVSELIQACELQ